MIYRDFKELKLSALGLGCMRLPKTEDGAIDLERTSEMVDYALKNGLNYFDTAWGYHSGQSETVMGQILSRYPRESYFLASKFPGYDNANFPKKEEIFAKQLEKCRTDHFDFYLMHNVCEENLDNYLSEEYGAVEYFVAQRDAGKIGHLGFSCHAQPEGLERFLKVYGREMEFCQLQLNYLDWEFQRDREKVELLKAYGIPVWVMEPVRGGRLVRLEEEYEKQLRAYDEGRSNAEWAFRFIQSIPEVCVTLSGMSDMDQLKENIGIFEKSAPLGETEKALLFDIAEKMISAKTLPCTGCRYCTDYCPQKLDIPALIAAHNGDLFSGGDFNLRMYCAGHDRSAWPTNCLSCGSCKAVCPQNIDIPAAMKDMSGKIDK